MAMYYSCTTRVTEAERCGNPPYAGETRCYLKPNKKGPLEKVKVVLPWSAAQAY